MDVCTKMEGEKKKKCAKKRCWVRGFCPFLPISDRPLFACWITTAGKKTFWVFFSSVELKVAHFFPPPFPFPSSFPRNLRCLDRDSLLGGGRIGKEEEEEEREKPISPVAPAQQKKISTTTKRGGEEEEIRRKRKEGDWCQSSFLF